MTQVKLIVAWPQLMVRGIHYVIHLLNSTRYTYFWGYLIPRIPSICSTLRSRLHLREFIIKGVEIQVLKEAQNHYSSIFSQHFLKFSRVSATLDIQRWDLSSLISKPRIVEVANELRFSTLLKWVARVQISSAIRSIRNVRASGYTWNISTIQNAPSPC